MIRLVSIAAPVARGCYSSECQKLQKLLCVSKADSSIESAMLEYCIKRDLFKKSRE